MKNIIYIFIILNILYTSAAYSNVGNVGIPIVARGVAYNNSSKYTWGTILTGPYVMTMAPFSNGQINGDAKYQGAVGSTVGPFYIKMLPATSFFAVGIITSSGAGCNATFESNANSIILLSSNSYGGLNCTFSNDPMASNFTLTINDQSSINR